MAYKFRSQTVFSAGSLSKLQQGRHDTKVYAAAVKEMENFVPVPDGPAIKRPGTYFATAAASNTANGSRLIPFYFGEGQAYVFEFYADTIRILTGDGLLYLDHYVFTVPDHTNDKIYLKAHGLALNTVVRLTSTGGLPTGLDVDTSYYVVSVETDAFKLAPGASGTPIDITGAGTGVHKIQAPYPTVPFTISDTGYDATKIHEIDVVQSADVLYITHKNVPLKKLERTIPASEETGYSARAADGTYWTLSNVELTDGPWDSMNLDNAKLLSITTGSEVASIAITAGGSGYTAGDLVVDHGSAGSGLTGTYTVGSGIITGITITNAGSGYNSSDVPTVTGNAGGSNADLTVTLALSAPTWVETGGVGLDTINNKFALFGHGLRNGMQVRFKAGTTPAGAIGNLVEADGADDPFDIGTTTYYVVNAGSSSFSLATIFEGTPKAFKLDTSGASVEWTGNLTIEKEVIDKGTSCTITASSNVFQTEDYAGSVFPNALLRVNLYCGSEAEKTKGVKWVWFKITGWTDATHITAVPQSEVTLFGRNTREFQFGALGGRFGYARKCAIHQQRLILAASEERPTTLWISNSGSFENFSPDTAIGVNTGESDSAGQSIVSEQILDDNSLNLTIDSDTVDRIYWLAEKDRLEIGTSGGPFHLYGSETSRTITPTNFTIQKASAWECADIPPVRVGNALVYVQLGKRKIRAMGRDQGGTYVAAELSSTSDYFQANSISTVSHQKQPHSLIWMIRDDGRLVSMSFDERDEFAGFAIHTIGGVGWDSDNGDHAKVESLAIIPRTPDDRVWMIVKRDSPPYAIATITIISATPADLDSKTATIVSTDGTSIVYTFDDSVDPDSEGPSVNIKGETTVTAIASRLKAAIEHSGGHNGEITVEQTLGVLTLTQVRSGPDGNNIITTTASGSHLTVSGFSGSIRLRHVEFMQNFFVGSRDSQQKAHFVDSGIYTESGTTISSITGLAHLEGETLDVLINGGVSSQKTVASGVITFSTPFTGGTAVTKVVTGLPYISKIHTLPVRGADDDSVFPLGRVRMVKAHLRFSETLAVQVGLETLNLEEVLFRTTQDLTGSVPPLFTGTKIMSLVGRTEEDESLRIISSGPLPLTLLNLITEHEVNIQ